MPMREGAPPIELVSKFGRLDGVTLGWEVLFPNYGGLRLSASRDSHKVAELQFLYPIFIECMLRMVGIRLRMGGPDDSWRLPASPRENSLYPPERTHVVIESQEGTFSIWAALLIIRWPGEELPADQDWKLWWPHPAPFEAE